MSRLRKGTLADLIADPTQWTLTSKLMSLVQIARTLNYCQRVGLIAHQDLKPDNIFFDLPKEKYAIEADNYVGMVHEIYVADFGIADAFRDIGKNSGSYPYMAPEQHNKGLLEDGSKIDVFALGSCPLAWCRSGSSEQRWLHVQSASAGILTMGLSLSGAMVSRVM